MNYPDIIAKYVTTSLLGEQCTLEEFLCLNPNAQNEVLSFAAEQGVISPFISMLNQPGSEIEFSDEVYSYFGTIFKIEDDYKVRIETMKQLARLFSKEGIDVMFLKGATLARLYPCPNWRPWSDIDYYTFGRSDDSICTLGKNGLKSKDYFHHHTQSSLNGVLIENHYDFFDRHNHKCNHLLDDFMKELAMTEGKSCPFIFEDALDIKNSYMLTPTMNAIFLMRHMSAHFVSETVPLRQLYDFALFLKSDGEKVDWKKVVDLYQKSGLMRFARIIVSIIKNNLGIRVTEDKCPLISESGPMAEKVWQSIISIEGGNPYKRYGFRYMVYEVKTFFRNRWKHSLVYPDESYVRLFFVYAWSHVKRIIMDK